MCQGSYAGGMPMHDALSFSQLIKILNSNQEQLSKIDDSLVEARKLNQLLGDKVNLEVLAKRFSVVNDTLWGASFTTNDSSYAMQSLLEDPISISSWSNVARVSKDISDKLYPTISEDGVVNSKEIGKIKANRKELLVESTKSSLVLAEQEQMTVKLTKDAILAIGKNAAESASIHEDLSNSNNILMVVASELIQIRQLLAKQLELISAGELRRSAEWLGSGSIAHENLQLQLSSKKKPYLSRKYMKYNMKTRK